MAIHLNDNGIIQLNGDDIFYQQCLEPFGITEQDLVIINRSMKNSHLKGPNIAIGNIKYDKINIDYKALLSSYFNFEVHKVHKCKSYDNDIIRRLYKDRVVLTHEQKIVEKFKAINEA